MKLAGVVLCGLALCAGLAFADDADDRASIERVIAGLNQLYPRFGLFTADSDGPLEMQKLLAGKKMTYQTSLGGGRPRVAISHRPWGEAQILVPANVAVASNPRVVSGAIRFVSEDVALVDGSLVERRDDGRRSTPLLFVVTRDGDDWRIASVRTLAER